ncbi:hypothetical protein ABFV51_28060, partial [Pseudomonas asgharzadehiana]|uniref:hypothetical protein n=1 Tax=Pseudomonas asgharzadehiana TaxID=2842349 RepID=UPI0034D443E2
FITNPHAEKKKIPIHIKDKTNIASPLPTQAQNHPTHHPIKPHKKTPSRTPGGLSLKKQNHTTKI